MLSTVLKENEWKRIDAEYFQKEQLRIEQKLQELSAVRLDKLSKSIINFGAYSLCSEIDYIDEGVPFLNVGDIKPNWIDTTKAKLITPDSSRNLLPKSVVREGQVLLTIAGTIGYAAVATELPKDTNSNQAIANITLKHDISPFYVSAFLNSYYGRQQTKRLVVSNVQPNLLLTQVKSINIPVFSTTFQEKIEATIKLGHTQRRASDNYYANAENQLLAALGLDNWQPPEPLTYEYSSSTVWAAGRLDAEHFQPKYRSLISHIKDRPDGCVRLGDLCPNPVNGVEVREYEDKGVPYLRVGDIHDFTVDENSVKFIAVDAAAREIEKVRLRVGDVLVSRSGSLAVIGVVKADWLHAVISSHLIRVRIEDAEFDPYYVATFLSSLPGKMQIEQQSNGGVQPEINQPALKSIVIPKLDKELQQKIRSSIEFGDATTEKAKRLLEAAKRAVEIAIEENEDAALAFLEEAAED